MKMFKSKADKAYEKYLMLREAVVLWLFRFSQLLFWIGFVGIIAETSYLVASTNSTVVYTWWQQAILYSIGVISVLSFIFGLIVFIISCAVDERRKRRESGTNG